MIFVNFKTYGQKSGENVPELIKTIEEVSSSTGVELIPVVQIIDAVNSLKLTKLGLWVQHLEITPKETVRAGILGTFLNHSDHRYKEWEELVEAVRESKESDLKTMVFVGEVENLGKALELNPTFVAYEPPELIGSVETSVSAANPEVIKEASVLSQKVGIPLIVGAGIKSKEDVQKSLELGAVGVAVSSAVTKALGPRKILLELTEGFKR